MELQEINNEALTLAKKLSSFPKIKTTDDYLKAGELWKIGKEMMKTIDEGYDSLIKGAHKLWKDSLAKKAEYYEPVEKGTRTIKNIMEAFDREEETKRQEAQRVLEKKAKEEEEERRLQEAIEAEEEAKANGLTAQEAAQKAEVVLQEPVYVPPVVIPRETPKVKGLSFREVWSAEIIDIRLLCKAVSEEKASTECVVGNMPALNKMATALKNTMNIPGVKAISKRV